jgi:hypothetical protein
VKGSDQIRGRRTLDCDAVQSVKHETRKGDSARGAGGGEYLWWGEFVVSVFDFITEKKIKIRTRKAGSALNHGGLGGLGGVLFMEAS